MANVTFLIGNGFDLQMKMKTRYPDFYKVYTKIQPNDNDLIRWFKRTILQDEAHGWANWSDFELGMGKQSDLFSERPIANDGSLAKLFLFDEVEDFMKCLDDFVNEFHKYLQGEYQKIDWDAITEDMICEFSLSLLRFRDRMIESHMSLLEKAMQCKPRQGGTLHFLQLNYTNSFDTLYAKSKNFFDCLLPPNDYANEKAYGINSIGQNLHIHGSLADYPIIGVNNADQIVNEEIRDDERVLQIFVKQNYITALHNRVMKGLNPIHSAVSIINNSDILCAFGTSIGETDKHWWKLIGDWLKNGKKYLVIFDVCGDNDDGMSPLSFLKRDVASREKEREILTKIYLQAGFSAEEWKSVVPRIFVELNTSMFNFTLPMKNPDADPTQEEKPGAFIGSAYNSGSTLGYLGRPAPPPERLGDAVGVIV
jgi:hypothetical protein